MAQHVNYPQTAGSRFVVSYVVVYPADPWGDEYREEDISAFFDTLPAALQFAEFAMNHDAECLNVEGLMA